MGEESNKEIRDICIQQGYVPPECKLDGTLVYLLIKEGNNPCMGCNCNCTYARPNRSSSYLEKERKRQFQKDLEKSKEKCRRVEKLFSKKSPTKVIMNVECGYKEVNVHVMNLETEKMYYATITISPITFGKHFAIRNKV